MEKDLIDLLSDIKNIDKESILKDPVNEQVLKLAFIGDTIFDLFTRDLLLRRYSKVIKMNELHKRNSNLVCAKSQARLVERLIDDKILDDTEIAFYKHARNAHPHSKSKNSSIVDYRKATGFEALLGYMLYMDKVNRLIEILDYITHYIGK
ncbi:MAG: RNAase [Lachnospiraceae bacterium]|nr:RNAase [Lachnospiraceae bacterium]